MANQKPVDEIRIGRVKATIWRNGTDEQPRHNVTFSVSTKTAINGRVRRASGATTCWCLRKWPTSRIRACSSFRQKQNSRRFKWTSPSGQPRQGAAEPFASPRLFFFFPLRLSVCLWCLSAHSGPPLAASQGNSRARTLRSLSASVTRVVLSGPCPSPRARSSLLLWFVVLPLPLVKGKHSKPSKETP